MTQFVTAIAETLHINAAFDALLNMFKSIRNQIELSKKVNSTIKELSQLSDKELADIGITRGMIRSIAMDAYNV